MQEKEEEEATCERTGGRKREEGEEVEGGKFFLKDRRVHGEVEEVKTGGTYVRLKKDRWGEGESGERGKTILTPLHSR